MVKSTEGLNAENEDSVPEDRVQATVLRTWDHYLRPALKPSLGP